MEYNFTDIEKRWQKQWAETNTYKVAEDKSRKKYYVLNMFPYPSGAGLHVGHPLGYIASDIYARYKRLKGFNVLNPMGYDAYGLPAEQYAIQTGQHPAITTVNNINRYREQLDKIGFSFDWDREVRTCDPIYYKWTQWAFQKMFQSYYCNISKKAQPIQQLIEHFGKHGTEGLDVAQSKEISFTADEWNAMDEKQKQETLMNYRIAYLGETMVNWCPMLGTVLANDEVVDGVSERGGYPVVQKKMRQWCLRVSAYAQRLLDGLDTIDWTDSLKETQRNWIGRSEGTEVRFKIAQHQQTQAPHQLPPLGGEPNYTEGSGQTNQDINNRSNHKVSPKGGDLEEALKEASVFYKTADPYNYDILKDNAKSNRDNPTDAENALWEVLKGKSFGQKFRRQHIIGDYIVDFVCLSNQLVIEVDGGYHNDAKQIEEDKLRTQFLNEKGFNVIRFTNEEIIGNIETVISKIKENLKETDKDYSKRSNHKVSPKGGDLEGASITIFTTRADTMFGVTFMVLAPESEYVAQVTTPKQKTAVDEYLAATKKRTERERISDRRVSGVFSGSYAINPFTNDEIPIWISDYVLAGYGTGAIMAVPAHDSRDYAFAKHFNLPIIPLIEGADVSEESYDAKEGIVCNSPAPHQLPPLGGEPGYTKGCGQTNQNISNRSNHKVSPMGGDLEGALILNGLTVKEAIAATKKYVNEHNLGRVKVNYRLRDAIFSRQRYWGEPFPVYYKNNMPYMIPEDKLPLELPDIDEYKPTENGEPPLGHAKIWAWDTENCCVVENAKIDNKKVFSLELNTMPGFAGSSAYYLRYMDPHNEECLVSKESDEYWQNVDLYVGGTEHATGHLIYSRFWNKFLHDIGVSVVEEPFKKLVNQGMIQGRSNFVYRIKDSNTFVSLNLKDKYDVTPIHVDVNMVHGDVLDLDSFKAWRPEYENADFLLEDGKYICGWAVEKMSKSMYNVVNPDMIVERYGADTLRLYEMFLGPVEQSKPWDTNGIDGCHRFLKKFWNLYYGKEDSLIVNDEPATPEQLKSVHKLIKKVSYDIENFSYNTSIAAFMICVNELTQLKCHNKKLLQDIVVLIAPFAPHIAEELWHALGNDTTVCDAHWPDYDERYLVESHIQMTVSFNGKARFQMEFPVDADNKTIEKAVLADEKSAKYLSGKQVMKVIVVPKRIVNIVVK